MHGHRSLVVVDTMDPVAGERERLAGAEPGRTAAALDPEVLARHLASDHVDAAARPAVVVEAAVPRLPPGVEPGLRACGAPEGHGLARRAAVECLDVDQRGHAGRDRGALPRVENPDRADRDGIDVVLHRRIFARVRRRCEGRAGRVNAASQPRAHRSFRPSGSPAPRALALQPSRAHSSAGERSLHTREVPGSIPGAPIKNVYFKRFLMLGHNSIPHWLPAIGRSSRRAPRSLRLSPPSAGSPRRAPRRAPR